MKILIPAALSLIVASSLAMAVPKSSDRQPNAAPAPNIPMMDFGCPNGSFVKSITYNVRTQQGVTVECVNRTSANANAPTAPSVSRCQPCVITPNGAKRINNVQSNSAGFCVYNDFPGQVC